MWQMSSHNTAISSRIDLNPCGEFTVTIHRYQLLDRAVVLYPLTHTSNASLLYLCMIIYSKPEVAVSQSLIILCCVHQGIHLSLVSRISLLTGCDAMFAYVKYFCLLCLAEGYGCPSTTI